MNRRTRVLPGSPAEYANAAAWYDGKRRGLGAEFAEAVRAALREIEERPLAWPSWPTRPEYRWFLMNRLPFAVFYRVTDTEVQITAVAHDKRKPGYWVGRDENDEETTPAGEDLKALRRAIDAGQRNVGRARRRPTTCRSG